MTAKPAPTNLEYLAGVRLSDIGYRRYIRMADSGATDAELREWIDRQEARELTLGMMVRCANMYKPLQ
jgi:hypothetical protein